MKHYKSISELHRVNGYAAPAHPLLSLLPCEELVKCSVGNGAFTGDFYMIGLKKILSGNFLYGKTTYDHQAGCMSFIKPRQVVEIRDLQLAEKAFMLFVHEDYLLGSALHSEIKKYGFFDYEANEAVHLAPREEQIVWDLYYQINQEYHNNQDEYSREIILTHLNSLLKYSQRFYKRQFIDRRQLSGTTASRFTEQLTAYFESGRLAQEGLPTVKSMAAQLHTSPRYLSDLLKQETGKTALDHIHLFLIDEAKNLLLRTEYTISQTAYALGFENAPYFARLFRKEVGLSPHEYRAQSLN